MKTTLFCFCILMSFLGFTQNIRLIDSLKKASRTQPISDINQIVICQKIATAYMRSQYDSSKFYVEKSLVMAEKINNDSLRASSLTIMGMLMTNKAKFDEALKFYQQALFIFEKINSRIGIGRVYYNLGHLHKRMGDAQSMKPLFEKALVYCKKAEAIFVNTNNYEDLLRTYNNMGIIYRDLDEREEAGKYLLKGVEIIEKYNIKEIGFIYANLGQIYVEKDKNYDLGIKYIRKSLEISILNGDRQSHEHALRNLAKCYSFKKEYKKAVEYGKGAVEIALTLKDPNRAFNSYQVLYKVQKEAGFYKDALQSLEKYKALEDSTLKNEKMKSLADVETKYETQKKEIEIQSLNLKNDLQERQLIILIGGLLALLGFIGAMFYQNKKINDSRNVITRQSDELKLMMKELHHRVKNNLAIVSSLLKIQSGRIEDKQAIQAVRQGQQRVEAMSLIHQRLYLTDKVTNINIKQYINDLAESLMAAYNFQPDNFDLEIDITHEEMDVDVAIPIGLIINELLTNSFKYAYHNIERPLLKISIKTDKGILLEVQDNGPGINLENWEKDRDSFGKKLIAGLTKQLRGNFSIENSHGTLFKLHIAAERISIAA
jgi:two-component sensor histidine kinase